MTGFQFRRITFWEAIQTLFHLPMIWFKMIIWREEDREWVFVEP